MSALYARLVELALGASSESPLLVLVAGQIETDRGAEAATGAFSFPREYLPAGADVRLLPADERYLDGVRAVLAEARPSRLFLAPPLLHHRDLSDTLRSQYPRMNLEAIALRVVLDHLPAGSEVGVMLPAMFLQAESNRSVRTCVFTAAPPKVVLIHAPSVQEMGWPVHPAFRMTTIVVEAGATSRPLRFFRCTGSPGHEEALIEDFTRLMGSAGARTRYGYIIREGLPPDAPLLYDLYDPAVVGRRETLAALGQVQRLGELADLRRGLNLTADAESIVDKASGRGVPVIEGRNIGPGGQLMLDDVRHWADVPAERQLQEGDLCLRAVCGVGDRIRVAEVTKDVLPTAASHSVLIIRLRPGLTPAERQTLVAYLRSSHAAEQLNARRGEGVTFTFSHLSDLSVPLLDGALSTALAELDASIRQFREWLAEADRARDAMFEFSSPGEDGVQLYALGRLSRRRCDAARLVSDLRHRIRTQYPHPIAFRWRTVEVARADLEGLQNVLECAEVAVCYLAFMGILLSRVVPDFRIGYLGEIAKRMGAAKPHGTNMGDWMAIVREVRGSKVIKRQAGTVPFSEITGIDDETDEALQRLAGVRNDVAHGRGPKDAAIPAQFQKCREDLEHFLGGIEFLAEYPLRQIERASRDALLGLTTYQFRELMGDHPLVPLSTATVAQSDLEESLYIVDRQGRLHLLRPFLNHIECPKCGRRATFYLDRYLPRDSRCVLKDMEFGHTTEDASIVAAYRLVGLLPNK